MDPRIYRKTEGILYNHFRKKKRVARLHSKLIRINIRINRFKQDIKNCRVELRDTLKAIDYSSDRVTNSNPVSNIEIELERAITELFRDFENEIREKRNTEARIRRIEKRIDDLDIILRQLTDKEMQILELKYSEEKNYRQMEPLLHMSKSTIQRKKDQILEFISSELWDKSGTKLGQKN